MSTVLAMLSLPIVVAALAVWMAAVIGQGIQVTFFETRHRLFTLRDELFQLGVSERVPFDSDAYRLMETMLNASIRFAHDLSLLSLLFLPREHEKAERFENRMERAEADLSPEAREALAVIRGRMAYWLILHVIKRSLVLSSVVTLGSAVRLVIRFARAAKSSVADSLKSRPKTIGIAIEEVVRSMPSRRVVDEVEAEAEDVFTGRRMAFA